MSDHLESCGGAPWDVTNAAKNPRSEPAEVLTCQACEGTGWVRGRERGVRQCPKCEGDGKVVGASFTVGEFRVGTVVPARFWPGK